MKRYLSVLVLAGIFSACTNNYYLSPTQPSGAGNGTTGGNIVPGNRNDVGNNTGSGQNLPNLTGTWSGIWLGNINISLIFTSNSGGSAVEKNGSIFSHGTVTVTSLYSTNIVMKIHLSPDTNPDVTGDYTVTADFLNNFGEMKGWTVSGTEDFDVLRN